MDAASSVCLVAAVLLRAVVSLFPYSGANTPPKFGDYEAQRHWMELTTNLPVRYWYKDGPDNDPKYWPLDYPPLSGYQSCIHGMVVRHFYPQAVELHTSRGLEDHFLKQLMRWTVIASDIIIFFPAAVLAARYFSNGTGASQQHYQQERQLFVLAAILLQPASILIDHGHFQYNCISLGLAMLAAVSIAQCKDVLGSVLFCLSLNHKQMGLFYAPAFFAHLLGRCLQQPTYTTKVLAVGKLALAVIATFVVCWSPWLTSMQSAQEVARRIFPTHRGLYEDYLSNFWCTTSVGIKWKQVVSNQSQLVPVCAGLTILAALPSMVQQMLDPSPTGLLLGLANSALAFFMFGYHVHEKSILLPLMPLTMLAASEPDCVIWGPVVAAFSMYPLLVRDGAGVAYMATIVLYLVVMTGLVLEKGMDIMTVRNKAATRLAWVALAGGVVLHLLRLFVPPPEGLLWLHDRLFVSYGFCFITAAMVYTNYRQWHQRQTVKQKTG